MTKHEAKELQAHIVPEWAFDAINKVVATHLGVSSSVSLEYPTLTAAIREAAEAVSYDFSKISPITLVDLVLSAFRTAGWTIQIDRPGWDEAGNTKVVFK